MRTPPPILSCCLALCILSCQSKPSSANPSDTAEPDACNGHPDLCERRLDDVTFPGTHNSMANAEYESRMARYRGPPNFEIW